MQNEFETKVALEKVTNFHFIDSKKNTDFQQINSSEQ